VSDVQTTVAELRATVQRFVDERDWGQFHNPKNLAMAIAIEAAELMEHFQWIDAEATRNIVNSPVDLQQVREELADILCYTLSFANSLGIDIAIAVREKMMKNAQKYPVERFRGRFK
jgi:dCTP diphosphatase